MIRSALYPLERGGEVPAARPARTNDVDVEATGITTLTAVATVPMFVSCSRKKAAMCRPALIAARRPNMKMWP